MKTERVTVRCLKVGDIFLRSDKREWPVRIVELSVVSPYEIRVTTEYVGDNIQGYNGRFPSHSSSWNISYSESRTRVITRTCAPCRDSDCDCIFDEVG